MNKTFRIKFLKRNNLGQYHPAVAMVTEFGISDDGYVYFETDFHTFYSDALFKSIDSNALEKWIANLYEHGQIDLISDLIGKNYTFHD